ncbi:MAG: PaaI family thioesterase [Armatimonadetes bacterium]|nr:PaaI family thioesterase [Armatimonadota bacterium]
MVKELLPNSRSCFVCGIESPVGMKVRFRWNGEYVWTEFTATPYHAGFKGVVHGGVLATLLDETMGWALAAASSRFCLAVELNLRYVKSAPVGRKLIIKGWPTRTEERLWTAKGQVEDEEGTVYVKAAGKYFPLTVEETDQVRGYLLYDEETLDF